MFSFNCMLLFFNDQTKIIVFPLQLIVFTRFIRIRNNNLEEKKKMIVRNNCCKVKNEIQGVTKIK